MRKANIESNVYLIPQSWDDLMYTDAVKYYLAKCNDANPNEIITLLTGISEEILLNLSTNSVDKLFDELSFVNDESIFEDTNVKDEYKDFDFGSLKYRESEKVKQLIDYKKSLIENAPVLFDYLFKVDLDKEPFTEWIGTVNFFLNKWVDSMMSSSIYQSMSRMPSKYKQELTGSTDSEVLQLT